MQHGSLGSLLPMPPSPSGSESSGRLSCSPLDTNSGMSHPGLPQHSRLSMSSPVSSNGGPLELTRGHLNGNNNNNPESRSKQEYGSSSGGMSGHNSSGGENNNLSSGRGDDQSHHHPSHSHHSHQGHHPLGSGHHNILAGENGMLQSNNKQMMHDAMKMAAMLGQGGANGGQNDIRNLIHQHAQAQAQAQDMMTAENMRMQAENLLRSHTAEALRLAVENHNSNNNNSSKGNNNSNGGSPGNGGASNGPSNNNGGDSFGMISQHQLHAQSGHHSSGMSNGGSGHRGMMDHRMDTGLQQGNNSLSHSTHHHLHHPHAAALNHHSHHQLNSILSQQPDLSEALMRLDARSLGGFALPAHNS